jgi:hypothetical protein
MKGVQTVDEIILANKTRDDIDKRVLRVLNELGNHEPPIRHEMIRELLKLDLGFFQKDDPGVLAELWSRLKRGTKQVVQRPGLLIDMLTNMSLRAAYLPDEKRIYIDNSLHPLKKRWGETHECIHGLLPWHKDYMLGDNQHTLTQSCRERLEAEANYGTGRLLFAGDIFKQELLDLPYSIKTTSSLSKRYGNSLTSTLWRVIDSTEHIPLFGYICPNHNPDGKYVTGNGDSDIHFIKSLQFREIFTDVQGKHIEKMLSSYVRKNSKYIAGNSEEILYDVNGDAHLFHLETINNRYCYLTLGVWIRKMGLAVSF